MKRLTLGLMVGASVLGSCVVGMFAGMAAQASPLIVNNSRPSTCKLIKNDQVQKECKAFKLIRVRDEEVEFDGFEFEFSFNDSRVSYLAVINKNVRTVRNNGKTLNFYPVMVETLEPRGREPKTSVAEGLCGIATDYSQVICQVAGSSYLYGGNPVQAQPTSGSSAQAGGDDRKTYTFQTNSHVDTGISVNSGDRIQVKASGRIRFGFFAGSGGPEGILFNPEYNYFIDMPHGQLMGRVRQFGMQDLQGWFPIGEGREFVVKAPGVLEFAVNDNQPGDNAGGLRIEVTIEPAK